MKLGVTGHQDLGDATEWCRASISFAVGRIGPTAGYTSLAVGADQLFAECLIHSAIPFIAVVPCSQYESTFAGASLVAYRNLLRGAVQIDVLPFREPSEEAFLSAGKRVVDSSEVLLAIWDGERARGRGGTGDIVAYSIKRGLPVLHINPVSRAVGFV